MEAERRHIHRGGNLKPHIVSDVGEHKAHMTRLLSTNYESRVTHAGRAPMRSSRNCGADLEEVCIGRARRSIQLGSIVAIHEW